MKQQLHGTREVAIAFGVTPQRIRQLVAQGVLVPDFTVGQCALFIPHRVRQLARERLREKVATDPLRLFDP